jgi:hypothetical protein
MIPLRWNPIATWPGVPMGSGRCKLRIRGRGPLDLRSVAKNSGNQAMRILKTLVVSSPRGILRDGLAEKMPGRGL